MLDWNVRDNVALGRQRSLAFREYGAAAREVIERFDVRPPDANAVAGMLSGGNQQKLVVGRALAGAPKLVVAYQPTRGIDVGAAALVQSRLIEARNAGVGVLLISFELDEIFALADRVLVLSQGRFVGSFGARRGRPRPDRRPDGGPGMSGFLRGRAARDILIAVVVVFGVGSLAMLLAHVSPVVGFGALFDGAFGTRAEVGETLVQATNLLFPALGIAVAFRAGLFNIGAEGQLILGGFAAGWLGAQFPLPGYLAIPMVLLAGALAGGVWGAIPGFLRARFGANEVIATLMLNVVAAAAGDLPGRRAAGPGRGRRAGDGLAAQGRPAPRPDLRTRG